MHTLMNVAEYLDKIIRDSSSPFYPNGLTEGFSTQELITIPGEEKKSMSNFQGQNSTK